MLGVCMALIDDEKIKRLLKSCIINTKIKFMQYP